MCVLILAIRHRFMDRSGTHLLLFDVRIESRGYIRESDMHLEFDKSKIDAGEDRYTCARNKCDYDLDR